MIKLLKLLLEGQYNYGCVMLFFNFPEINNIHNQIEEKDLYVEEGDRTFGLEEDPHCTLLYGLHEEVTLDQIKNILKQYTFFNYGLHNVSLFEKDNYDVLKFDVYSPTDELESVHNKLSKLPNSDEFPNYHPHMTIAYLKKGMGKKYVKMFKDQEYELVPSHAVFSQPNGKKNKIPIKIGK